MRRDRDEPNLARDDGAIDAMASLALPVKSEALAFVDSDELPIVHAGQATGNEADVSRSASRRQAVQRMRAVHISRTRNGARRAKSFALVALSSPIAAST